MEKEILKLKVENLIALRTSVINALIILAGGVAGLMFLSNSSAKYFLLIVGFFYITILISNIVNISNKISKVLKIEEDRQ